MLLFLTSSHCQTTQKQDRKDHGVRLKATTANLDRYYEADQY